MQELYDLKEMLCKELKEYGEKGELTAGTLDVVDKLAHTIKNLDKIIEKYEDEDYSSAYDDGMMGGPYERDGNRGGNRYSSRYAMARGRGRNARRDSMGRYSSDSRMMVDELRDLMNDAPDERTKMEFKKFIEKMEQM